MIHVVKLGGSLLDLPDLPARFERWRPRPPKDNLLLVVGGGEAADVVRRFDALHRLGDERGHWLAVRAMALNTRLIAAKLPRCALVCGPSECPAVWRRGDTAVVEPLEWLEHEERAGVSIPHRWSFTSDSIAAHIAQRVGAAKLTLLKSTLPPGDTTPPGGSGGLGGVVDDDFAQTAAQLPGARIEIVNLRATPRERYGWR